MTLLLLASPSLAWACGGCTDALLRKSAWWTAVPVMMVGAFVADWLLFQIYAKERLSGRAPLNLTRIAVFLFVLIGLVAFGLGTQLTAMLLLAVLAFQLPRTFFQVRTSNLPERRLVEGVRLAILVGGLAFAVASAMPQSVPTQKLIEIATAGSNVPIDAADPKNWAEAELARRGDAAEVLEKRLHAERAADRSQRPSTHEERLARLHFLAGGPAEGRKATCVAVANVGRQRALAEGVCEKATGEPKLAR